MAFSQAEKLSLLDGLTACRRQSQLAEVSLRLEGHATEADRIRDKTADLSKQIDGLMAKMMNEWQGQAAACVTDVGTCTAALEQTVNDIKKQVKIAQNVVKAVGFVDDAVAIAKKALA